MNLACIKKVDERAAVAKYNVTPIDTKWVDTDKAFEGKQRVQKREQARLAPPLEALKAIISIAASHSPEFSLMHVDVSRAYFHVKGSEACASEIACRRLLRKRENRIVEEEHVRYQRSTQLGTRLAKASGNLGMRAGAQFKKSVSQHEEENLGFDTRRRLCGDRIERESVGA